MSNSMTPMRLVRGMSRSLFIGLLLLTCGALSAQKKNLEQSILLLKDIAAVRRERGTNERSHCGGACEVRFHLVLRR
jgi:hypothetical protein